MGGPSSSGIEASLGLLSSPWGQYVVLGQIVPVFGLRGRDAGALPTRI